LLKPRKTRDLKIERFASRDSLLIYVYVMYIYVYWIYKQIHTHPIVRPIVFLVQKKQSSRPPYHICSQPILLEHSPNCMSWFEYFWIRGNFLLLIMIDFPYHQSCTELNDSSFVMSYIKIKPMAPR
jgi:hypothetical protein